MQRRTVNPYVLVNLVYDHGDVDTKLLLEKTLELKPVRRRVYFPRTLRLRGKKGYYMRKISAISKTSNAFYVASKLVGDKVYSASVANKCYGVSCLRGIRPGTETLLVGEAIE